MVTWCERLGTKIVVPIMAARVTSLWQNLSWKYSHFPLPESGLATTWAPIFQKWFIGLIIQILSKYNTCSYYVLNNDLDGLVQERCNSIANAMELRLSCTNPSIWSCRIVAHAPCHVTSCAILWHNQETVLQVRATYLYKFINHSGN